MSCPDLESGSRENRSNGSPQNQADNDPDPEGLAEGKIKPRHLHRSTSIMHRKKTAFSDLS